MRELRIRRNCLSPAGPTVQKSREIQGNHVVWTDTLLHLSWTAIVLGIICQQELLGIQKDLEQLLRSLCTGGAHRAIHLIHTIVNFNLYLRGWISTPCWVLLIPQSWEWANWAPSWTQAHRIVLRQLRCGRCQICIAVQGCVFLGSLNRLPNQFCAQRGFPLRDN